MLKVIIIIALLALYGYACYTMGINDGKKIEKEEARRREKRRICGDD